MRIVEAEKANKTDCKGFFLGVGVGVGGVNNSVT